MKHLAETFVQLLLRNLETALTQQVNSPKDRVGIVRLARTHQGRLQSTVAQRLVLQIIDLVTHPQHQRFLGSKDEFGDLMQLGVLLKGEVHTVVGTFANHARNSRLHDACLLGGNLGQRIPQELHVVERDIGDDRHFGSDDVGAVQPTT